MLYSYTLWHLKKVSSRRLLLYTLRPPVTYTLDGVLLCRNRHSFLETSPEQVRDRVEQAPARLERA